MTTTRVGDFYTVEPGQGEPEFYPGSLEGLVAAMKRAQHLSAAGGVQRVLKTCGRVTSPIREYDGGRETGRSSAAMIPAGSPASRPPGPVRFARRPRPELVFDINEPPCDGDLA